VSRKRRANVLWTYTGYTANAVFHVKQLRNLSARPELVVGTTGPVYDIATQSVIGIAGPFGNERLLSALPLNKAGGPHLLAPALVLHDAELCYLGDPDGNLIGTDAVWVHRMLSARWTADTRRLAG
jgi:hypothetical protein